MNTSFTEQCQATLNDQERQHFLKIDKIQEMRNKGKAMSFISRDLDVPLSFIRKHTKERDNEALKAAVQHSRQILNMSISDVCKKHNVARWYVSKYAPCRIPAHDLTLEDIDLMQALIDLGYSVAIVSEKFEVSRTVVTTHVTIPENVVSITGIREAIMDSDRKEELIITKNGMPIGTFRPN